MYTEVRDRASDVYKDTLRWAVNQRTVKQVGKGAATLFPTLMADYVAGETREEALDYVEEELNPRGVAGLVDLLGEHHEKHAPVTKARDEYGALLKEIDDRDLDAELSVKLTQLGLDLDEELCWAYVDHLAEQSTEIDRRLWIDMEDKRYTDRTVDIYEDLLKKDYDVGICLQAYLERTEDDIETLPADAAVRLVKGAYDKDREFDSWEQVDRNYEKLMERLFDSDMYVAVGTHDTELLETAHTLVDETGKDGVEIQFLQGVMDKQEMEELAADNHVAVYVPFGEEAFDYFWRRVQEHPKYLEDAVKDKADSTIQSLRERIGEIQRA